MIKSSDLGLGRRFQVARPKKLGNLQQFGSEERISGHQTQKSRKLVVVWVREEKFRSPDPKSQETGGSLGQRREIQVARPKKPGSWW